jgi:translation initiation factor 5
MAVVNIPRDVKDEFYRYKMPALIAKVLRVSIFLSFFTPLLPRLWYIILTYRVKVEGRGNGIKTVIVNMSDIAKSLARPPAYPTKFFGFEV